MKTRTSQTLIPRLSKYTFFTPINFFIDKTIQTEKMTLEELRNAVLDYNIVRATCRAKIFNYFNPDIPLLTSVLLFCKICNYQNQLPFHFTQIFYSNLAPRLFSIEFDKKISLGNSVEGEVMSYLYKKEFSLDWLFNVTPSSSVTLSTDEEFYYYDCPRCYWLNRSFRKLDYIYRFALTLIDKDNFKIG